MAFGVVGTPVEADGAKAENGCAEHNLNGLINCGDVSNQSAVLMSAISIFLYLLSSLPLGTSTYRQPTAQRHSTPRHHLLVMGPFGPVQLSPNAILANLNVRRMAATKEATGCAKISRWQWSSRGIFAAQRSGSTSRGRRSERDLKNAVRASAIDYLGLAFVEWRNNVVVEQFRAMFGPRQCCVGLATGWHHFVCEGKAWKSFNTTAG